MNIDKYKRRARRKLSIQNKIRGTKDRPRLTVFRSASNIYAQIIDDEEQVTLCSASTLDPDLGAERNKCNMESARKVGNLLSERALKKSIKAIVFDRNGYKYHGRIKAIASSCREAGLQF